MFGIPFGFPPNLTLYELVTDWGGLFGAGVTLIAGVIAYRAAKEQANATLRAVQLQISADETRQTAERVDLRLSIALEVRRTVTSALGAQKGLLNILNNRSDLQLTARVIEDVVRLYVPIVYPATASQIGRVGPEAMEIMTNYHLAEIARDAVDRVIRSRSPDNVSPIVAASIGVALSTCCLQGRHLISQLKTGNSDVDNTDELLFKEIDETNARWENLLSELKLGPYRS